MPGYPINKKKFPGKHQVHPTVLYTNTLLLSWLKEVKIQCPLLNIHLWVLLLSILHFGSFLQLLELYQQLLKKEKKKKKKKQKKPCSRFQLVLFLAQVQFWCPTGRTETWCLTSACSQNSWCEWAEMCVCCGRSSAGVPPVCRIPNHAAVLLWRHLWQCESLHVPKVHVYSRRRIRLSWQPAPLCKWLSLHFFF